MRCASGFPSHRFNGREKTINPFSSSLLMFCAFSVSVVSMSLVPENSDISSNAGLFHKRPANKKPCPGGGRSKSLEP